MIPNLIKLIQYYPGQPNQAMTKIESNINRPKTHPTHNILLLLCLLVFHQQACKLIGLGLDIVEIFNFEEQIL